jgi:hypothetical protein
MATRGSFGAQGAAPASGGTAQRRGAPVDPNAPAPYTPLTGAQIAANLNGGTPQMVQTYGTGGATMAKVGDYLHNLASDPGPSMPDNSPLMSVGAQARGTSNRLAAERGDFSRNPGAAPAATPTAPSGLVQLNAGQIDPVRQQQQQAIAQLQAAAAGQTPSAAELQSQQQGNRAAAQQFGMASALQGGLSPGAALRQASEGAAGVQADVANQGAVLRANEMAGARGQLVQGLAGVRGQEQDLAGTNAGLAQQTNLANAGLQQQTNLANLNSQLTTTGQNQDWQKALLAGELQSNQTGASAAGALADANAKNAAAANQYNSSYVQQGKQLFNKLIPF